MDTILYDSPFARLVAASLREETFNLVDVGCGGGLPHSWRTFGDRLAGLGIDTEPDEVARLIAVEPVAAMRYLAAFIDGGPPSGVRNNPWTRLAISTWLENHVAPGAQTAAVRPTTVPTISLPTALAEAGLERVDFLKLDVDGPDFGILSSMQQAFGPLQVLGVGLEVNFIGSAAADEHSFHNTDRMLRQCGFDLFDVSLRRYSSNALPGRSRLVYPAETGFGRLLQGDAVYFRDLCAPYNAELAASLSPEQLMKQAAVMSLFALPDCAAEILTTFSDRLAGHMDVTLGLDTLAAQAQPDDPAPATHAAYIAAFKAGDPWFRLQADTPRHLRPHAEPAGDIGVACSAYDAAVRVVHGEASCTGDETLSIVTAHGQYSFGVEFPVDRAQAGADEQVRLSLEVIVEEGVAGVGLLDRSRAEFHEERILPTGAAPVAFTLVSPRLELTDALMVRNQTPGGAPARLTLTVREVERLSGKHLAPA